MRDHSTFKIVDGDTGNTVGFYEDREVATAAFRDLVSRSPAERQALVLIAMDKIGRPVRSWLAEEIDAIAPA